MFRSVFFIALCTPLFFDGYYYKDMVYSIKEDTCPPKSTINDGGLSQGKEDFYSAKKIADNTKKPKERPEYIKVN